MFILSKWIIASLFEVLGAMSQLKDCRDHLYASAEKKQSNAVNHFNAFLRMYCTQNGFRVVSAEDVPLYGFGNDTKDIGMLQRFWSALFGTFVDYLNHHTPLAMATCTGYLSSMKGFYITRFRPTGISFNIFNDDEWSELHRVIGSHHHHSAVKTGKPVTNPQVPSSDKDRDAIAFYSLVFGTAPFAEFWQINNSLFHLSGRITEVACLRVSDISIRRVDEGSYSYDILQCHLKRFKNGKLQELPLFPHRDCLLQDFYFSLLYHVVMNNISGTFICPSYADVTLQGKKEVCESQASQYWSSDYVTLKAISNVSHFQLNEKLTSHHGKKGSNQKMAESSTISGIPQIFRSGWTVNNIHTLFDYVHGSSVMLKDAGKVLSNWHCKSSDFIEGGLPPSLLFITKHLDLLERFIQYLFAFDVNNVWSTDIRRMLVASLFRFYDKFKSMISIVDEYKDGRVHPFVGLVCEKLKLSGVSPLLFDEWKASVIHGFVCSNACGLPYSIIAKQEGLSTVMIDTRCFSDDLRSLRLAYGSLFTQFSRNEKILNDVRNEMVLIRTTQNDITNHFHLQTQLLEKIAAKLDFIMPSPIKVEDTDDSVQYLSVVKKTWKKNPSISDYFVSFFAERLPECLQKEKEAPYWCKLPSSNKKSLSNLMWNIKTCVRVMLMFASEYPSSIPTTPEEFTRWKARLQHEADSILTKICNSLGIESRRRLPITTFVTHPIVKGWLSDSTRHLPSNTPDEMIAYFKKGTSINKN